MPTTEQKRKAQHWFGFSGRSAVGRLLDTQRTVGSYFKYVRIKEPPVPILA
jgi:hypothetical protein